MKTGEKNAFFLYFPVFSIQNADFLIQSIVKNVTWIDPIFFLVLLSVLMVDQIWRVLANSEENFSILTRVS